MRSLRDLLHGAMTNSTVESRPLSPGEVQRVLQDIADTPPLPRILTADRIQHAPGELVIGQRVCDHMAKSMGEFYFGGIRIEENPMIPPGYAALMKGDELVGMIGPKK